MEKQPAENMVQNTLCIPLWGRMIAERRYPDLFPSIRTGAVTQIVMRIAARTHTSCIVHAEFGKQDAL